MSRVELRLVSAIGIAGIVGCVGFGLFFTDPTPGEQMRYRVVIATCLTLVSGWVLGRARPREWLLLALLAAWGPLVAGLMGFFMYQEAAAWIGLVPVVGAILGGSIAVLGRKRTQLG